jgi:hypothetical protein
VVSALLRVARFLPGRSGSPGIGREALSTLFGDELAEGMVGQNPPGGISFIEISKAYRGGYAYRIWTGHTAGDAPDELDSAGKIILTGTDMKVAVPWSKQ